MSEEQQLAMAMQLSMQGAGLNDAMETEAAGKVCCNPAYANMRYVVFCIFGVTRLKG